ncbi:MAG: J domain-containing protein [Acidimicrobiales bacterium]|nr:J domain-containing protein [Acidimicrobiales bacterium]
MLLAELEVFNSRPIAPTRRVSVGTTVLPVSPSPGFGGLLLGGVVANFIVDVDPDLVDDLYRLSHQLEAGQRVPQPRLRHRFQEDRIGLTRSRHRLIGEGDQLVFDIDRNGSPTPQVLGAVYAAARLEPEQRGGVFTAIRSAIGWRGEIGPKLVAHLSDARDIVNWSTIGGRDPVTWALEVLGLPSAAGRSAVQQQFRALLREAHPDHGGAIDEAAKRISDLSEARRILLSTESA